MTTSKEKIRTYAFLNGKKLRSFYRIEIYNVVVSDCVSKRIRFISSIHENKVNEATFSWCSNVDLYGEPDSNGFSDAEILRDHDLITWVINSYGDVWGSEF